MLAILSKPICVLNLPMHVDMTMIVEMQVVANIAKLHQGSVLPMTRMLLRVSDLLIAITTISIAKSVGKHRKLPAIHVVRINFI